MKTLLFGLCLVVPFVVSRPAQAQLLADARTNYAGETVGSVMTPLPDTQGTGTWAYYLAQVNNASVPTGFGNLEALTYEANGDGGSAPYLYGTTNSNSSNIINLPSISNGQLFGDSPPPSADFLGIHPSAGTNAGLVQWTAGVGETGTLSLTFDLSRLGVTTNGAGPTQGYVDFNVFENSTPIFSADNLYAGTDTGPITELLPNVTVGTTVNFVISSGNGVLGFNQAFLSGAISAIPEHASSGEVLYYDTNGVTPGTATTSTQNFTDSVWTLDPTGSVATTGYVPGSDVVFSAGANGTGTQSVTLTDSELVNSFIFKNGTVTVYGSGNPALSIGAVGDLLPSGIAVNSNDGPTTFDSSLGTVSISTDQAWNNNSTQALNFNAAVSGTGNTITFAGTGTGAVNLNGNIVGSMNLTAASSSSTLYLNSESNNFSGTITVDGGSLVYQNQGSLNNNAITLSNGGLLESANEVFTTGNDLLSNNITLGVGGGKVSAGVVGSYGDDTIFSGTFTGGTGLSVVNGDFITQNDGTSNVGTLTVTGSRLLAGSGGIFGNNAVVNVYSILDFGWNGYSGTLSNTINLQNGGLIENRGPGMNLSNVVFPTGTATVTLGADDVGGGSLTINGPGINLAGGTTLTIVANGNEHYPEYTSTDADPTDPANNNAIYNFNVAQTAIHLAEQITGSGNLVITPEQAAIINVNTGDTVGYRLGFGSPIYLDGANNYSGTTTVDGAIVYVGASGFGTSSVTLNSGRGVPYYDNISQLELSGGTFANALTVSGGPSVMNLLGGSPSETVSGPITITNGGATLIVQNSSSSSLSVGSIHINAAQGGQHGVNFEDYGGGGITLTGTYASDYVDHNGAPPILNFGAGGENGTYTFASSSDFTGMQNNNPGGFGAIELWNGTLNIATSAFNGQWLDLINNPAGTYAINLVGSQTVDLNIYTSNISTYTMSQTAGGSSTWSGSQQLGYYDPTYSAAAGSRLNISGAIIGQTPNGLTISGQGIVVLSSPTGNDYNRADLSQDHTVSVDIQSGSTLLITNPANTSAFGNNSGQVRIEVGATLGGTGVATQAVNPQGPGAVIAPGDPGQASLGIAPSIGTLHLNGGLQVANGVTLDFKIDGLNSDTIDFGGSYMALNGTVTFNFTGTPVISAANNDGTYNILTGLNLDLTNQNSGDFSFVFNAPDGYTVSNWDVVSGPAAQQGSGGQDYIFVQFASTATPEPSTYAMLGLGFIGFFLFARRRMA